MTAAAVRMSEIRGKGCRLIQRKDIAASSTYQFHIGMSCTLLLNNFNAKFVQIHFTKVKLKN